MAKEDSNWIVTWSSAFNLILLRGLLELVASSRHGRSLALLSHIFITPETSEASNLKKQAYYYSLGPKINAENFSLGNYKPKTLLNNYT